MGPSTGLNNDLPLQSKIEVLFPIVATIGVIIRFLLRHRYKIALLWDDALIALSVLFAWGLWGVWYWTAVNLIGNRETALQPTTPALPEKLCMAMDILYGEGINVVKFAILAFFLRAFGSNPNAHRTRLCVWILIGVVALFAIARAIETAYLCLPICFGLSREYSVAGWQFAMRSINWVTEIVILLFPIPILWSMMISTRAKLGIYVCFFLGIITCAASAGRLVSAIKLYLAQEAIAKDAINMDAAAQAEWFYSYYIPQMSQMTLWSMAELCAGIITATLPAIRSPVISLTKSAVRKFRESRNVSTSVKLAKSDGTSSTNTVASDSTTLFGLERPLNEKKMSVIERQISWAS